MQPQEEKKFRGTIKVFWSRKTKGLFMNSEDQKHILDICNYFVYLISLMLFYIICLFI